MWHGLQLTSSSMLGSQGQGQRESVTVLRAHMPHVHDARGINFSIKVQLRVPHHHTDPGASPKFLLDHARLARADKLL